MQTPREVIWNTLRFQGPDRFGHDFPEPYGSDFVWSGMNPHPDDRTATGKGVDEWGCVWDNIGTCSVGEVQEFPLEDWDQLDQLQIPDVTARNRFDDANTMREKHPDKFILAGGTSIYERIHFLRGLENAWTDIYEEPERLGEMIDRLADMNIYAIEQFAAADIDGIIWPDDWGLQDRLMISPDKWREIWKPRYARIYDAAREHGIATFLHSCGHIVSILDDLIEIGLDAVHMDQQENMGLELLGERFGGRITFFAPVDIQQTMSRGNINEIRTYCASMVKHLHTGKGGLIPRTYSDRIGAGHTEEATNAMCEEFLRLSDETFAASAT